MAADYHRIDIAFQGGQVLSARVTRDAYETLRKALEDAHGERWHMLDTQDSQVALDLPQVVYLRLDTEEGRVGF